MPRLELLDEHPAAELVNRSTRYALRPRRTVGTRDKLRIVKKLLV
jgi:hypothetical protein